MATIKEIARCAGVSTTTVSNVIHGKTKKVSPATIQKIEQLIKEMGYVQKMGLRVLNKEQSQLIVVVINTHKNFRDSVLGDPFYGKIIGFIEEYVRRYRINAISIRCRDGYGICFSGEFPQLFSGWGSGAAPESCFS